MYSVTVVDVNTINYSGKRKSRYTKSGIINGKQAAFKKAIVTLKEGETIDFFSNIKMKLRLSHIYRDLITTDDAIHLILERHGFTNYKLFRRMFHEHFGDTPLRIRNKHKSQQN